MRILLSSDLHYRLRQYDWLTRVAASHDVVVVAGDHIDISSSVPAPVQIAALRASLGAIAQRGRLLVCSGNHDLNTRNAHGEKTADWLRAMSGQALATDGESVVHGDVMFTVCPWWDGPHAQAGVAELLEQAARDRAARGSAHWVWVYHAPPEGALSWTGRRHIGDALLASLIDRHQPDIVLCGHIHEAPFRTGGSWIERRGHTWLFNAGHQIGDVPSHVVIDLAARRASWHSMEGVEERDLSATSTPTP